jgi:molecular chaperone GrpE
MSDIEEAVQEHAEHERAREQGAAPAGEGSAITPQEAESDHEASEIGEELDELVKTAAQRDEYLALAQRTQADFENYRKRVAKESATALERGVAKLVKELLPALDNLDRALEAAAEEEARRASGQRPAEGRPSTSDRGPAEDSLLLEGVRLVRAELSAALARVGVESFDPSGEQFDPAHHEAMAQQPVEGAGSGTVVEVYQPGYRLKGTVIRPARVVVAA